MLDSDVEATSGDENEDGQESSQAVDASKKTRRKKSYVYRDVDDIQILKEVIMEKPVGKIAFKKWQIIFRRLQLPVPNYRSIQNRFDLLFKAFKKENLLSLRRSGTDEEYNEKEKLLTDIAEQIADWKDDSAEANESQKKKTDDEIKRANAIREASLTTLTDTGSPSPLQENTPRKRPRQTDFLEILKTSEETKQELERRRLDFKERELQLREENEKHRREVEKKQLEMDEKRLKLEEMRLEKEHQDRMLLFRLIEKK